MNEDFEYRIATVNDIEPIKKIHQKYHLSSFAEEDKKDGFVTTNFTDDQLKGLIEENGLFICLDKGKIVGYVTSASWNFWKEWPMYEYMISELPHLKYHQEITVNNSYQYGPVCVDKEYRGKGILEQLFDLSAKEMGKKYDYIITFINKINPRSYAVHTRKLQFEVVNEFSFNNNHYFELIYPIRK